MKEHIVIGIKQADGSIIPLPEMGVKNSFTVELTPAHLRQRKIKLSFLSLSGVNSKKQVIGHVKIRINKNTIQESGALKLHCMYRKNRVCIALIDAHAEEIPIAMFRNRGTSKAGVLFKLALGIAYSAAIALLVLYIAEKTIPGIAVFQAIGLKLPF